MTWSLSDELAAVRGELARVDSNCATLAGLAGAAAAFTATQIGHGPFLVRATLATAGLAFTAAVLVLLLTVLRPRLGTAGWCRYTTMTAKHIASLDRYGYTDLSSTRTSATDIGLEDLLTYAHITHAKHRRFRIAVDLAAGGVLLLAAAIVAEVIA